MYALAYFYVVLAFGGPVAGQRNPDAADRWTTGATQKECEENVIADWRAFAEKNGDHVIYARVVCERVGT